MRNPMSPNKAATILILTVLLMNCMITTLAVQANADVSTDDWPMFNHDAKHTGFSQSTVPKNATVSWIFTDPEITRMAHNGRVIMSTPIISKGVLYVSGAAGKGLNAVNASTGQLIWRNPDPYLFTSIYTSTVYNDRVYVSAFGLLASLNASTGVEIWRTNFTNTYGNNENAGSPIVVNGVVYVQGYRVLYAVDALTGSQIWKYPNQGSFATSIVPAITNGYVYSVTAGVNLNGSIYALDASSGKKVWEYNIETSAQSSPVIKDGKVFVGSNQGIYSLDALTGKLLWKYAIGSIVTGSLASAYNLVYVGAWDNNIYALNASTGERVWNFSTAGEIHSTPAIADNTVSVSSDDRYLYVLNASTGDLIWKYLTTSSKTLGNATHGNLLASPAIANGNLYISTEEGNVVAFGNKPTNITPTPLPPNGSDPDVSVLIIIVIIILGIALLVLFLFYKIRRRHFLSNCTWFRE